MWRKMVIPGVALIGIALSLFMVYQGRRKPEVPPILFEPARSPYKHFIAGEGIIESVNEEINLSVAFPDLVTEVYHKTGDKVKKGTPLFKLDTRRLDAELKQAQEEQLVAEAELADAQNRFSYFERLKDKAAVSEQDFAAAKYAFQIAQNRYKAAIARVGVAQSQLDRSVTRAPYDGEILKVNIREGEFGNVNPFDRLPLMLFGNTEWFDLRISIDEADAWRFMKGSRATAFVRGNAQIVIPLEYVSTDPYMIPKRVLTGSTVERADTRVLQVIYRFTRNGYPVYAGQLLDVFIEAEPLGES